MEPNFKRLSAALWSGTTTVMVQYKLRTQGTKSGTNLWVVGSRSRCIGYGAHVLYGVTFQSITSPLL